jgi:GMP synthase (glutamine-hydrolysing)
MSREVIAIIDFGSQYGQLIARRVREHKVYSQIYQPTVKIEKLAQLGVKGIILSGGPASVYAENAPTCDPRIFELGVPVLGICYGMQIGCKILGARGQAGQEPGIRPHGSEHPRHVQSVFRLRSIRPSG